MMAADHLVCQVVPVANGQPITGRTRKEIKKTFNQSNHFLKDQTDYRGASYDDSHPGDN